LRETGERDIILALAGKVPGMNLTYNNNGIATLIIRGGSTLEGNNDPLYVVDGSIVDDLSFLNINDVDRIDVLKDGSIYGARGANGAIVVSTNK
jgi:TonB-dependent SusC/RagA subfamily outer membrane receptor